MLGDDLEEWLQELALMKRTFRNCAIISGLIERNFLERREKTGRQVRISTDLIYDVLRRHEPDHILLQAARADAATGLLDVERLAHMLSRVQGKIMHKALDRVSPLAVPIMLEIGRESVYGEAQDAILAEAAEALVEEVMTKPADEFETESPERRVVTLGTTPKVDRRPAILRILNVGFIADPAGALYWAEQRLLIVADLHLEKGSAFAARKIFLPPYDTAATLEALALLHCFLPTPRGGRAWRFVPRFARRRAPLRGRSRHDPRLAERAPMDLDPWQS